MIRYLLLIFGLIGTFFRVLTEESQADDVLRQSRPLLAGGTLAGERLSAWQGNAYWFRAEPAHRNARILAR